MVRGVSLLSEVSLGVHVFKQAFNIIHLLGSRGSSVFLILSRCSYTYGLLSRVRRGPRKSSPLSNPLNALFFPSLSLSLSAFLQR